MKENKLDWLRIAAFVVSILELVVGIIGLFVK